MEISPETLIKHGQAQYEKGKKLGVYRGVAITLGTIVLLYLGSSFATKIIHSLYHSENTSGIEQSVSQKTSLELPEPGNLEKII